jgi:hypothetical protein
VGRVGPYQYRVLPGNPNSSLVVTSGSDSITVNISWTFGVGVRGQTFLLEHNGAFYDSQVSSFASLREMAITPGHTPAEKGDLLKALGMKLSAEKATRCFGCHTTGSTMKDQFEPQRALPGVHCEACHGPGLAHAMGETMERADDAEGLIFNPRSLSPVESVDFCGACHMTALDVMDAGFLGPNNVRFQPFRLEKSRCWGASGDKRLVCSACHDPHQPLVHDAAFYDQRCLSCHTTRGKKLSDSAKAIYPACPKASSNCTTCHMPKYDVPEMHGKFTDHFIRIVRDGEPYPRF